MYECLDDPDFKYYYLLFVLFSLSIVLLVMSVGHCMMPDGWNYVAPPKPRHLNVPPVQSFPTPTNVHPTFAPPPKGAQARKPPVKHKPLVSYQYPEPWPPEIKVESNDWPVGWECHSVNHELTKVYGNEWRIRHYGNTNYINTKRPQYCPECGFELAFIQKP